jgi:putative flavoprotein involved in K+ transport
VTAARGLYFLGLPWQYTWGSGRFSGVARDAACLAERIAALAREDQDHAALAPALLTS